MQEMMTLLKMTSNPRKSTRLPSMVEMISLRGHQVIILALVISAAAAVMGAVKRKHFPIGWWRKTF